MTIDKAKQFENLTVLPAGPEQKPILANLLELYAHDFSEFHDIEVGPDGRFGYISLPLYWSVAGRHPFLVRVDGRLAGFVLVKKGSELTADASVWDMAEFFILRRYRRRGIGTHIADQIWKQFPGRWEVRVMDSNLPALTFWKNSITKFAGKETNPTLINKSDATWQLFSFESK